MNGSCHFAARVNLSNAFYYLKLLPTSIHLLIILSGNSGIRRGLNDSRLCRQLSVKYNRLQSKSCNGQIINIAKAWEGSAQTGPSSLKTGKNMCFAVN